MTIRQVYRDRTLLDPLAPASQPRWITRSEIVSEDDGEASPSPPVTAVSGASRPTYVALAQALAEFAPADGRPLGTGRLIGEG